MVPTWGRSRKRIRQANSVYVVHGKKRKIRSNVAGVSIRSKTDAPSRRECVAHGQMTKESTKSIPPQENKSIDWTLSFTCKNVRLRSGS